MQPFCEKNLAKLKKKESVESTLDSNTESNAESALDSTIPQNLKSFCYFWLSPKVESPLFKDLNPLAIPQFRRI